MESDWLLHSELVSYLPPPAPGTGPYPGPPPKPPKPPKAVPADPLAVALGNASLLGVGYVLIRRWKTAIAAILVTAALVVTLALRKELWCEIALVVWWVVPIVHGWFLARRQPQRTASTGKRLIAAGVAVPVLFAVGFVRYDAARVAGDVAEARAAGDCAQVVTAQDKVWSGHRVLDGREMDRGDDDVAACDRLDTAAARLRTATLKGDPKAVDEGFGILSDVLADPGQEQTVRAVLDEFLRGLPSKTRARRLQSPAHCGSGTRRTTCWTVPGRSCRGSSRTRSSRAGTCAPPPGNGMRRASSTSSLPTTTRTRSRPPRRVPGRSEPL